MNEDVERTVNQINESAQIFTSSSVALNHAHDNNQAVDTNLLKKLYENSIDILARVSVIEESMIKNGFLKPKSERLSLSKDHFDTFMKSNNLPLKSVEHMNTFNQNLKNEAFKKTAVS